MNQVRTSRRRDLMRPSKVRIGLDEGEQGLDLGGVQQEFFRLVFAQALSPDYAMFSVDERIRVTWCKAGSQKPLDKFEVLGGAHISGCVPLDHTPGHLSPGILSKVAWIKGEEIRLDHRRLARPRKRSAADAQLVGWQCQSSIGQNLRIYLQSLWHAGEH